MAGLSRSSEAQVEVSLNPATVVSRAVNPRPTVQASLSRATVAGRAVRLKLTVQASRAANRYIGFSFNWVSFLRLMSCRSWV